MFRKWEAHLPLSRSLSFPSTPFPPLPPFPEPSRGYGGPLSAPPAGSEAEHRAKTNLVQFRAVRKPLVVSILSILKCMFHSKSIKILQNVGRLERQN